MEDSYICFVHPKLGREIRRLYADIAGSPIVKHQRRRGIRGRKQALMSAWHPVGLGKGATPNYSGIEAMLAPDYFEKQLRPGEELY